MRFAGGNGWLAPGEMIEEFSQREKEINVRAHSEMPETELMMIEQVRVSKANEAHPRKPLHVVVCSSCNELVFDHKEVARDERILCTSCAFGAYYEK